MHAAPPPRRTRALVLLGHGSSTDHQAGEGVRFQARTIRRLGLFDKVLAAFWKEKPHFREVLALVKSDDLLLVPCFLSQGYFTRQVIPRAFGLTGCVTRLGGRRLWYGEPLGEHPAMTRVILGCARNALREGPAPQVRPGKTTLLLVGHGTERDPSSARAVRMQAARLRRLRRFKAVLTAFLEQPPFLRDALARVKTPSAVVVPFLMGGGPHERVDVRSAARPGLRLRHARAVGLDPAMTPLLLERARDLEKLTEVSCETSADVAAPFRVRRAG